LRGSALISLHGRRAMTGVVMSAVSRLRVMA
jgi:hypothetical protein